MKQVHTSPAGLPSANRFTRFFLKAGLVAALASPLASCRVEDPEPDLIQPTTTAPANLPNINAQMLAVIEQYTAFNDPPLATLSNGTVVHNLTARQARMNHSVTDAENAILAKNGKTPSAPNLTISQEVLPKLYTPQSAADGVPVRIYKPAGATGALPGIVYLHGGGWVIGSLNVYEPSAKALANNVGAVVVSVDYRLASETMNKFPAAHEDAYAAYKWVRRNAVRLGIDSTKIAVAGESAGGNMATGICLLAKQRQLALPVHQLLVYPVADNNLNTASYVTYANAVPLSKINIQYFTDIYFNSMADGDNQLISLVDVADLSGLPTATIIAAEIDPLQTEGQLLRDRLTSRSVGVDYTLYPGTTHEFFGTYDVVPLAQQAQQHAADRLKAAFGK